MRRSRSAAHTSAAVLLAVLLLAACADAGDDAAPAAADTSTRVSSAPPAAVTFDTATITFITGTDTIAMPVEIAERQEQRAYGLMDRDELPAGAGMIFLYDQQQPATSAFWMYRTRIPLDIAYFDGAGRILAIRQMMPCASPDPARCSPGYAADVPYYGAVEANRGYFARTGISIGDRLVLPGRIGSR